MTQAVLHTNRGDIRINLFADHAPKTVAQLRRPGRGHPGVDRPDDRARVPAPLYDGMIFHRVIAGFMIQGGDPLGTGTGGPGYQFDDEFHPELQLRPALPAGDGQRRARTPTARSSSSPSAPTPHLNFKHTIFGEVADQASRDVVDAIATTPTGPATARRAGRHRRR